MKLLFINIKGLLQVREASVQKVSGIDMNELPEISNAFLQIDNGYITRLGSMDDCPELHDYQIIDASGKYILPTWCDSHTHIVYAGNRESEFVDRINGLTYEQIAQRGGGILNSAETLNQTSEEDLYLQSKKRLNEVLSLGTGAIEIKSGYGLSLPSELKMLRVIQRLALEYSLPIRATFLAAHALPKSYNGDTQAYVDYICTEMIPEVASQHLADYIDVFCETGYFTVAQTKQILTVGRQYGLIPKVHVNQFTSIGGVAASVQQNALSVDHLEILTSLDIEALRGSETMPVALPGCSFFLGIPYTPVQLLIQAGLPVALASDYNPGSCPTGNMNFVVATACIKLKLTPEQALNAATLNGAYAMGLSSEVGSITPGKLANIIVTKPLHSYYEIPYNFASNPIESVYIRGRKI